MWVQRLCHLSWLVLFSLLLSSCMVGPNFLRPQPIHAHSYTPFPVAKKTVSAPSLGQAGKAQTLQISKTIPLEWWKLYHSRPLNQMMVAGINHNQTLATALAALAQAQENVNVQIGQGLFPNITGQTYATRQRLPGTTFGTVFSSSIFNTFNAQVNVAYTLDVFGGARRQIEALTAEAQYQEYELKAAYLTMTSNIATAAITAASLRGQIAATQKIIQIQATTLNVLRKQLGLGGAAVSNVLQQQTQLATTEATLPPLMQQLAQTEYSISVLVGELPSQGNIPPFTLSSMQLPTSLPITLPSQLVRQRPDILAAEAQLHAACANIGVATANLFPQITLQANYGWTANTINQLFSPLTRNWLIGTQLLQPIFQGGALHAARRASIQAYKQALAQYKQVVLQAFQNVADTLQALQNDAVTLQAARIAEVAAHHSFNVAQKQFKLGGVSYLQLLTTEQQYQQTSLNRIKAEAARYADTAALFQALGGGWW